MTTTLRPAPPDPGPRPAPGAGPDGEPLLREVFGDALRRARRMRGHTLRDVAEESRVSLAYLSEVERGRKEASSEILGAVCTALGISVLDLVTAARRDLAAQEVRTAPVPLPSRPTGTVAMAA